MEQINKLVQEAHENAKEKGLIKGVSFIELITGIHSEATEVYQELRSDRGVREIYNTGEKPCGVPIELADIILRVFSLCGEYGIDIETAIKLKMEYNKTRPHKHGWISVSGAKCIRPKE